MMEKYIKYVFIKYAFSKFFIFAFLILIIRTKLNNIEPKISVIIPTYNRGNLIANSIKGVLNQTYKNLEIIIVDDGSIDNTKEEVFKILNDRIKYIKLAKNSGGSNARNVGIKSAKGSLISFQDSDDIFYPNKLELQSKNIFNKHSHLDFCKIKVFHENSFSKFYPNERQENSIFKNNIFNELISKGNFISTQSILVKSRIMKKFCFDINLPRWQDYDLILRMLPKIKISYTNKTLVELHHQKDSITFSPQKLKKAIKVILKKEYNFNSSQRIAFLNYLRSTLIKKRTKKKSRKKSKIIISDEINFFS